MTTSLSLDSEYEDEIPEKWESFLFYSIVVGIGFAIGMVLSLLVSFIWFPVANLRVEENLQKELVFNAYAEYAELREQASIAQSEVLGTPIVSQAENIPDSIRMLSQKGLSLNDYLEAVFFVSFAIILLTCAYIAVACMENGLHFFGSGAAPFITLMASLAITFGIATSIFAYTQPTTTDDSTINQELVTEIKAKPMIADYLSQIDYADSFFESYLDALAQNDTETINHFLTLGINKYISQDTIAQNLDQTYGSYYDHN